MKSRNPDVDLSNIYETRVFLVDLINHSEQTYKNIGSGTGLSPSTIARLAEGRTHEPRYGTVIAILRFFKYRVYAQSTANVPTSNRERDKGVETAKGKRQIA